jgi:hypothetical protein
MTAPAIARGQPNMQQWEYRKLDLNDAPRRSDDIDLLEAGGKDGWELAAITANNFTYLKRRIDPAPKSRKATTSSK